MSLKPYTQSIAALALLYVVVLPSVGYSQDVSETSKDIVKLIPADKTAIEDQAEFLAKNVPAAPLPAGSPQLESMRQRAKALQEQRSAYLKDVAAGKTDPFGHLREARSRQEQELLTLQNTREEALAETDPEKRDVLSKAFFAALQPIGPYLEHAAPGTGYTNILTEEQQAEMDRLEQRWDDNEANSAEDAAPAPVGPGQLYTVTGYTVPLAVKTSPSATVYFRTHGGGQFPNNLSIIAVEADDSGLATTEWVTHGDAIGDAPIAIRVEGSSAPGAINITTVQLKLPELPAAPIGK